MRIPIGTQFYNPVHGVIYEIIAYDEQGRATVTDVTGPNIGEKWQGYLGSLHQCDIVQKGETV